MSGFRRLPTGGRIDRARPLAFTLDGKAMRGFAGDTLAAALLAAGGGVVGRSFKYHRPRGVMTAGPEEPNALFTLGIGATQEPNIPGTQAELVEGLDARTQNGWPSVRFDALSINQRFAKLLSAGFYYKTFMGPRKGSWMFYEPFIRRAAGLGQASTEPDAARYETRRAFTDVLVVGGGPAGLAAALAAARAGARVILAEQDTELGGSLLSEPLGSAGDAWRAQVIAELKAQPRVTLMTRTTAQGLYDGNTVGLLERRDHLAPDAVKGDARQLFTTLTARRIVFATGAFERPLVFADNDRPGVMLAGAALAYLHRFAVAPDGPALVVTNNDSAYRTAHALQAAGIAVTVADTRAAVAPALAQGLDLELNARIVGVTGAHGVRAARLAHRDGQFLRALPCALVAVSGGWSPAVHLTSHTGIKPRWDENLAAFLPGGFSSDRAGCGALMGQFVLAEAIASGFVGGRAAAQASGFDDPVGTLAAPELPRYGAAGEPLWQMPNPRKKKAFLDFQNDVSAKDVEQAYDEGYRSVEHLKRYTTLGMGTDQGKTSNVNALAIMAGLRDVTIPEAGTTTFRPPFTPLALGALAGRAVGKHFRPIRRSPLHQWQEANGGVFIEAGPWLRCWYYTWAGQDAASAYIKEMELVRRNVGVSDVSYLGKIDLQGPDVPEFLNRVYVNGFAKLPVGKARYGVMLNDDAVALDDGTTTRLGENRFFMTTTTAQAGEVMSWLEFLLETAWPELRVQVTSITDAWGAMAVSGPNARKALELCFPGQDLTDKALPYMGVLEFERDAVPFRLIRLSFSGELAYEVYTPADYTQSLWEHLLTAAAPLGIKPYGLEALASLRIEKGHVAGLDLDHRNTLDDIGLGRMAGKDKDYVGRALRFRPRLQAPERWSLVGLELLDEGKKLRGGAILFPKDAELKGHGHGWITSVTWSTELKKYIALALYDGGLKHEGEEILCAYPLLNETVRARVVSPHFIDQEGKRLHV
jgi:heterotetrameric sarcosine oxidase alpha subunit